MKVGRDANADRERVAKAREAIGRGCELFVDANGAYTRKLALEQADIFSAFDVRWFEEPVSSDDLEGLRFLRDRAPAGMDIAAGEYGYELQYFDAMIGAVDVLQADASNYRQVPIGVVLPRTAEDVIATVSLARKFGAPILARGGGTSLAGQCCNVAVVMDFSKYMNHIIELDLKAKFARVEPGLVLDDLRNRAEEHQLTFGHDPATHS